MINGFVVVDKPAGITSHDVVSRVRRILGTRKVGHTGTLDPFATGVLPVAVNDGTKAIPFLDEGRKSYQAVMRLGVATDTQDMTGAVLSEADTAHIDRERFEYVCSAFTGSITQIPPMYSAIKRDGQPLYKLARQGIEVERQARSIQIHSLEILHFDLPFITIHVSCSRGTYIRTLADDIGRELGCGAALQELRRTSSGPFRLESAISLEQLADAAQTGVLDDVMVSPLAALDHLADIVLTGAGLKKLSYGIAPGWEETVAGIPAVCDESDLARLSYNGVLAAVAQMEPGCGGNATLILKRVLYIP